MLEPICMGCIYYTQYLPCLCRSPIMTWPLRLQRARVLTHPWASRTRSNDSPLTLPPRIDVLTFWMNPSRFFDRSFAASGRSSVSLDGPQVIQQVAPTFVQGVIGVARWSEPLYAFVPEVYARFEEEKL